MVPLHKSGNALLKVDPQDNRKLVNLCKLVVTGIEMTKQKNNHCSSALSLLHQGLF
jgi:hypothetical protein